MPDRSGVQSMRSARHGGVQPPVAVPGVASSCRSLPVHCLVAVPGPTHHHPAALRWSQVVPAMTTPVLLVPITTPADPRDLEQASAADAACGVCPHPHTDHDAIAARFCSATGNGAIARGCVCQS